MTQMARTLHDSAPAGLLRRPVRLEAPAESTHRTAPRIVLLSASVGAGHIRAAQAIAEALSELVPEATIEHVDVLKMTNRVIRSFYSAGYFRLAAWAPHLVGFAYDKLDRPDAGPVRIRSSRTRRFVERLNFSKLIDFLCDQPWDLAINTHYLPSAIISQLALARKINFPQAAVVTDYDLHRMWINPPCARYFVATEDLKADTVGYGVPPERVSVTGIPISSMSAGGLNRAVCAGAHGLRPGIPVVLQLAGGAGVGAIERIYRGICDIPEPLQIVTVTGRNEAARKQLEAVGVPLRHSCRVLGFTRDMHELMAAADVVVSKPGGLTTAETLAGGCPMAIVQPIPGQEFGNADYLLENGCAIKIKNLGSLTHKLGALLRDPQRLAAMRSSALRCARPTAARDVAAQCVALLNTSAG